MKQFKKHAFFVGILLLTVGLGLSACVGPSESEDHFERPEEVETVTLKGEIFPFSVSVSTSATHRLESDGRLGAYLASDIVDLKEFEGQSVEIEGVWHKEKMREIFRVEAVRLQNSEEEEEEETENRFLSKKFTFVYPATWEYSMSPGGVAHFTDKNDAARRVFLMFSVEDMTRADTKKDPNILIGELTGNKKITTDQLDREREEITLFSNLFETKYKFIFTSQFEEFEKKKAFFKLLNTFTEGEEKVAEVIEEEKRVLAEKEAEKIRKEKEKERLEALAQKAQEEENEDDISFLEKILKKSETDESEEEALNEEVKESSEDKEAADVTKLAQEAQTETEEDQKAETSPAVTILPGAEYTNLINEKAFDYTNELHKFSMQVPWGFWFWNFGSSDTALVRIGFSNQELSTPAGAKYWLQVIESEDIPDSFTENIEEGQVVIKVPRTENSYFQLSGPVGFRDAMLSIASTIK